MEENNQNEEFIWEDDDKGFGEDYSQEEREKMEEIYANTLTEITEKEVVKGTIVGINDRDIIMNIGFKSDGLVSAAEFRREGRQKL
jgi:small subunit ribosomal protein S1